MPQAAKSKSVNAAKPKVVIGGGNKKSNTRRSLFGRVNKWAALAAFVVVFGGIGSYFIFVSHADTVPGTLLAGQSLMVSQQLTSPDGSIKLAMQTDGNLVLYNRDNVAIWNAGTRGTGANQAVMQGDGNFVVYAPGRAVWNSGTYGKGGNRLTVQNDANLVIYTASNQAVWNSGTSGRMTSYVPDCKAGYAQNGVNRTNTLRAGDTLEREGSTARTCQLTSSNRAYRALFQSDGNFVVYTAQGRALWSSGTSGKSVTYVALANGNRGYGYVTIYDANNGGTSYWNNANQVSGPGGNMLVMQDDGNLVLYTGSGQAVWSTGTRG